jgi:hypothetical protein
MNENVVIFQSVIENGMIRLPEIYSKTFTTPVLVTVRENKRDEMLTADEITARLNAIYCDSPSVIDDDIQLMQYNLVGEEDW